MKKAFVVLIVTLLVVVGGCAERLPEKVDVRGEITQISERDDQDVLGVIMIEGEVEKDTQVDKAAVTVTEETKIFTQKSQDKLETADFSILQEGSLVEATFTGPVRESYPVQATAATIIVKSDSFKGSATPENKDRYESVYNGVELRMDKTVYDVGEVMDFTIVNASNSMISFGRPYTIERYEDGQWSEYPLELNFTMELILLEPGKSFKQPIPLDEFEPGKYRVIKKIKKEEENKNFKLTKEFEVR